MHHDTILITHESVDGVVLVHGSDACILSGHLRLKLQKGSCSDLSRDVLNRDCLHHV